MAYCRFGEADIYLFDDIRGGITCCCCRLAPKVKSVFTTGGGILGAEVGPCPRCNGKGCDHCMMHGDTDGMTHEEAIEHILAHRKAGDDVPDDVLVELRQEAAEERNE